MADGVVNIPPADPSTATLQTAGNSSLSTLAGIVSAGKALVTETSGAAILAKLTDTLARFGVLGANGTSIASSSNGVPVVAQTSSTWDVADRAARLLGALTGVNGSSVATGANPIPVQLSSGSAVLVPGPALASASISIVRSIPSIDAQVTLATAGKVIKAAPGMVYGIQYFNNTGGAIYIQIFNSTSLPSAGDRPVFFPGGSIANGTKNVLNIGPTAFGQGCPTGIVLALSSTQDTFTAQGSTAFLYALQYD